MKGKQLNSNYYNTSNLDHSNDNSISTNMTSNYNYTSNQMSYLGRGSHMGNQEQDRSFRQPQPTQSYRRNAPNLNMEDVQTRRSISNNQSQSFIKNQSVINSQRNSIPSGQNYASNIQNLNSEFYQDQTRNTTPRQRYQPSPTPQRVSTRSINKSNSINAQEPKNYQRTRTPDETLNITDNNFLNSSQNVLQYSSQQKQQQYENQQYDYSKLYPLKPKLNYSYERAPLSQSQLRLVNPEVQNQQSSYVETTSHRVQPQNHLKYQVDNNLQKSYDVRKFYQSREIDGILQSFEQRAKQTPSTNLPHVERNIDASRGAYQQLSNSRISQRQSNLRTSQVKTNEFDDIGGPEYLSISIDNKQNIPELQQFIPVESDDEEPNAFMNPKRQGRVIATRRKVDIDNIKQIQEKVREMEQSLNESLLSNDKLKQSQLNLKLSQDKLNQSAQRLRNSTVSNANLGNSQLTIKSNINPQSNPKLSMYSQKSINQQQSINRGQKKSTLQGLTDLVVDSRKDQILARPYTPPSIRQSYIQQGDSAKQNVSTDKIEELQPVLSYQSQKPLPSSSDQMDSEQGAFKQKRLIFGDKKKSLVRSKSLQPENIQANTLKKQTLTEKYYNKNSAVRVRDQKMVLSKNVHQEELIQQGSIFCVGNIKINVTVDLAIFKLQ